MTPFITKQDILHEQEMSRSIEKLWRVKVVDKGDHFKHIDRYAVDKGTTAWWMNLPKNPGKPIAHIELRWRDYTWSMLTKWGGIYLNIDKYEHLMEKHQISGLPAYFVVRTPGKLHWIEVNDIDENNLEMCIRKDRREGPDEMCIKIKCQTFDCFKETPQLALWEALQ